MARSELRTRAEAWIEQDPDPETRSELTELLDDESRLADRFGGTLQFGTAGIRGVLGAGPTRMNRVVVLRVSAGIAAYYRDTLDHAQDRGVVIGYDGRTNSRVFAEDAARAFLGAGFRVRLATHPVPTPLVAFAVKDCEAATGVMITASHNPPEYNGYKVYAPNGAQIIPPHDTGIADCIEAIGPLATLPLEDLDATRERGRLVDLGTDTEDRYLAGIAALQIHPNAAAKATISIAYTPLHGVGAELTERALAAAGFDHVFTVPEQREPDAAFPTVAFPNPEEDGAMDLVLKLGDEVHADLVLANDPDADRLAVALPHDGGWKQLTGDQVGVLLAHYLITEGPKDQRLVACSIVSSQLLGVIADAHGVAHIETLTGFKWIANTSMEHQRREGGRFVLGYEEALGYSIGELVRDKDGISAVVLFAELTARAKAAGRTVNDLLDDIYRTHGVFLTRQKSLMLPGPDGLARMQELMAQLRAAPPDHIGGYAVEQVSDLAKGDAGLPPGDVLVFRLEGGRRVIMRPSGTEPKLKSYYEVREPVGEDESVDDARARAEEQITRLLAKHQETLQ